MASIVLLGGAVGCLSGGYIIDWLTRKTGDRFRCRRLLCSSSVVMASISLLIGINCDTPVVATLWTAGSLMLTVLTLASWWGSVSDLSGRHLGALFGLMNSLGGFGGMASQSFVGNFATWAKKQGHSGRAQWDPMFYVYAGVLFIGAMSWLFIDARRSVEDAREDS